MRESNFLAFDLGASSGKAVIGRLCGGKLALEEINRFSNENFELDGTLYWDFPSLWRSIIESLNVCSKKGHNRLDGIGIDTWGVDFGILGEDGKFVREPICYRDRCTEGMDKLINAKISQREMYNITGFTVSRVGTLPQLAAIKYGAGISRFRIAKHLLMMPDLFRFFLGGSICTEKTIAGSSLVYNIKKGCWSSKILKSFGLPKKIFPKILEPGTITGRLKSALSQQYNLNCALIIAVAEHDTPSAFAASPYCDKDTIVISCGTWSVLGQSVDKPILINKAFKSGFINEPGFKSILFVQNMMGLYLFENLKKELSSKGHRVTYSQMVNLAQKAKPFENFLYTNTPMLFAAKESLGMIKEYLRETGQKPVKMESVIRLLLEGLAFGYKSSIEKLKEIRGRNFKRICMVGGGVRNALLCQMVADITGLKVVAGPVEATVTGNLAIQAFALGQLKSPEKIREMVRKSFQFKIYIPKETGVWDKKYQSYKAIEKKSIKMQDKKGEIR